MKVINLVASLVSLTLVHAQCGGIGDIFDYRLPMFKCFDQGNASAFMANPASASAADLAQICQNDDCKTAFNAFNTQVCNRTDDSMAKYYNCGPICNTTHILPLNGALTKCAYAVNVSTAITLNPYWISPYKFNQMCQIIECKNAFKTIAALSCALPNEAIRAYFTCTPPVCTANDWYIYNAALQKCAQSANSTTIASNPFGASAQTIAQLCTISDCKKTFQALWNLPCTFPNENLRTNYFCGPNVCNANQLSVLEAPLAKCGQALGSSSLSTNVIWYDGATIDQLCKYDDCRTAFKSIATLSCPLPNETIRTNFNCPPSACNDVDLAPYADAFSKCVVKTDSVSFATNPFGASADTIAKYCKIDECKLVFKSMATLPCIFPNESTRSSFNCISVCNANDLAPLTTSLAKCTQHGGSTSVTSNPFGASTAAIAQTCPIDNCKTAFKSIADLPCAFPNETLRSSFNCIRADCNANDFTSLQPTLTKCGQSITTVVDFDTNIMMASADAINKFCKYDSCRAAFKSIAALSCALYNESTRVNFNCTPVACEINDLLPVASSFSKCAVSINSMSFSSSPFSISADTIAQYCNVDVCKPVLQFMASRQCILPDESLRKNLNCTASASFVHIPGVVVLVASLLAILI
ncbi:hypothetical protein AeMF1_012924 [Aphanomyces euteiches]|nr:hypothetical protein AeMF1_012924 [Aphanomyces euteiches]KAH9188149.1 hypothetical protein AeNC1_009877 [Aphanomyces euteiches]